MYCWVIATPFPARDGTDPPKLQIYGGLDEDEATAVAREAAPSYRKVVAKAIGGVLLYRKVNPVIRYDSYATVGWDGVNYRRVKQIYYGHDRNAAIDVARRHAGEFPLVEVWANGEYEEGFDDREPVLSIPAAASPTTP
jgi:hypothetical protein